MTKTKVRIHLDDHPCVLAPLHEQYYVQVLLHPKIQNFRIRSVNCLSFSTLGLQGSPHGIRVSVCGVVFNVAAANHPYLPLDIS